jgi:hypothetical protein
MRSEHGSRPAPVTANGYRDSSAFVGRLQP